MGSKTRPLQASLRRHGVPFMAIELFRQGSHVCLMFSDLNQDRDEAVQSNQFLVVHDDTGAIIDPGGNLAYNDLYLAMSRFFSPSRLTVIAASHADPDIIAALDRWMSSAGNAKVYVSRLWERFAPHFCKPGKTTGRIVGIGDEGMHIPVGKSHLIAVPAHFMHAEGNFHFYDPISRILFTGDLGASLVAPAQAREIVTDFEAHRPRMEAFHRRYMVSNKILRYWVAMARTMKIDMLVPQHGSPMRGPAIPAFFDWLEQLPCGVDLMTEKHYRVPVA
jgi:flavorubredoxin